MVISDLNYMESAVEREVVGGAALIFFSIVGQSNVANQAALSSANSVNALAAFSGNSTAANGAAQSNNIG